MLLVSCDTKEETWRFVECFAFHDMNTIDDFLPQGSFVLDEEVAESNSIRTSYVALSDYIELPRKTNDTYPAMPCLLRCSYGRCFPVS